MTAIMSAIVKFILSIIASPLNALLDGMAIREYFAVMQTGLEFLFMIFDYCNFIIPVDVVFACVGVIITIHILSILWNWVDWLLTKICQLL